MKRLPLVPLLIALVCIGFAASRTSAAATTAVYKGPGWTLKLTFKTASYGEIMNGTFSSAHQSFPVKGDWVPAADAGSYLLRFYGHPFGEKNLTGMIGVATLVNTCTPYCAASINFRLHELQNLTTLPDKLPGVGAASVVLQAQK